MINGFIHHLIFSGIENLPFELQRNFQLMRDLDQRTEGVSKAPNQSIYSSAMICWSSKKYICKCLPFYFMTDQ